MSACDCFLLHAKQSFLWTPFESWGVLIWLVVLSTSHILAQQTRSLLTCWGVTSLSMCIITHLHSHRVLTFTDFWRVLFILLYSVWYPGLQTPVASIYSHSRLNFSMKKSMGTFLAHSFLQVWHSHSPCFLLSPLYWMPVKTAMLSQSEYPQLYGLSYLGVVLADCFFLLTPTSCSINSLPLNLAREALYLLHTMSNSTAELVIPVQEEKTPVPNIWLGQCYED